MKEIQVRIDAEGEVHLDIEGIEGASCEDLINAFTDALQGDIKEVQRKPEFYCELEGMEIHQYEGEEE